MILTLIFSFLITNAIAEDKCPYQRNSILPEIEVNVEELKNGEYKYRYRLSNSPASILPVGWFLVETNNLHENVQIPNYWKLMYWGKAGTELLKWAVKSHKIGTVKPGLTSDYFEFTSKNSPGLVKFGSEGVNYTPRKYQDIGYKVPMGLCPGIYQVGSSAVGFAGIHGITIGPAPKNRISPEIKFKKTTSSTWTGDLNTPQSELVPISPIEEGNVQLAFKEDKNFSADEIILSTVQFGRGKAKPIKTERINGKIFGDEESKNVFTMTFNLQEINVLCNADHALFLKAKMKDGKDLFTGVKIKPTECTMETWKREMKKMIDSGQL